MKVNEAPKKIYVHVKNGKAFNTWNSVWIGVNDIEYVQTDAFIEKACSWMRNYVNPTAGTYLLDEDIEKFRKAMKGE